MSEDTPESVRGMVNWLAYEPGYTNEVEEMLERYAELLGVAVDARKQGWNDGHESRDIEIAGRDAEIAALRHSCAKAEVDISELDILITALKARVEELEESNGLLRESWESLLQTHNVFRADYFGHMAACAGVWVPVGEKLPEISGWYYCIDEIGDFDERMCGSDDGEMRFIGHLQRVTHWLDARLPGGQITSAG